MSHAVQYDSATQAMRDTFLSHLNSTRNFAVAVVAVLVWDTLTNLPREYRNVWNYKFSPITLAYAIARYWILVALTVTLYLMYWVRCRYMHGLPVVESVRDSLIVPSLAKGL